MKVALCQVDEIPEDGAKAVAFFGREVLALKAEGRPRAVVNVCMHLGGPLERRGEKLVCAWHGAEWACGTGRHLAGPGRPDARLLTLPTRVENGVLTYVYGELSEEGAPGAAADGR
ncbi:MAG TPA: Rieske 2Fe-2S domain-containing protein [Ktedonobacterales bacterium]|nr:Rieske 2Fe-2S domain-containing protein [Ktedonobacterales bacterium]